MPRDNRAGGVGYHWYFAAGHYLKKNPGLSLTEIQERAETWARSLGEAVRSGSQAESGGHNDWDDLREYIRHNLDAERRGSQLRIA